jgi:hypothetical protein
MRPAFRGRVQRGLGSGRWVPSGPWCRPRGRRWVSPSGSCGKSRACGTRLGRQAGRGGIPRRPGLVPAWSLPGPCLVLAWSLPAARCRPPRAQTAARACRDCATGLFLFPAPIHPSAWKGDSTKSACMIPHNPGPIGSETPAVACNHRCRDAGMLAQTRPISEPERASATDPEIVCAPAAAPLRWPDHREGYHYSWRLAPCTWRTVFPTSPRASGSKWRWTEPQQVAA